MLKISTGRKPLAQLPPEEDEVEVPEEETPAEDEAEGYEEEPEEPTAPASASEQAIELVKSAIDQLQTALEGLLNEAMGSQAPEEPMEEEAPLEEPIEEEED